VQEAVLRQQKDQELGLVMQTWAHGMQEAALGRLGRMRYRLRKVLAAACRTHGEWRLEATRGSGNAGPRAPRAGGAGLRRWWYSLQQKGHEGKARAGHARRRCGRGYREGKVQGAFK
jgi:hypothetical protein